MLRLELTLRRQGGDAQRALAARLRALGGRAAGLAAAVDAGELTVTRDGFELAVTLRGSAPTHPPLDLEPAERERFLAELASEAARQITAEIARGA